jgi:hypothetical protein
MQHWLPVNRPQPEPPRPGPCVLPSTASPPPPRPIDTRARSGVHQLSTMGRACGGPDLWEDISPAVVLARAAADAAAAAAYALPEPARRGGGGGGGGAGGPPPPPPARPGYYGAFALAGEAVPYRSGLDASPSGADAAAAEAAAAAAAAGERRRRRHRHHSRHHYAGHYHAAHAPGGDTRAHPQPGTAPQSGPGQSGPEQQSGGQHEGLVDAVALLGTFSTDAAPHLPPVVLMSSLGDHMVQVRRRLGALLGLGQARAQRMKQDGASRLFERAAERSRPAP